MSAEPLARRPQAAASPGGTPGPTLRPLAGEGGAEGPPAGGGKALVAPRLDLRRLTARLAALEAQATSRQQREAELLKLLAALTGATAVILFAAGEAGPRPLHRLLSGTGQGAQAPVEALLKRTAARALESEATELAEGPDGIAVLAVRLSEKAPRRALTLALTLRRQAVEPFLAVLQLFAALLERPPSGSGGSPGGRQAGGQVAGDAGGAAGGDGPAAALRLAEAVAAAETPPAQALAEALREASGAAQVAVCRLRDERARLEAVSGTDLLDRRARRAQIIEEAAGLTAGTAAPQRYRNGAAASSGTALQDLMAAAGAEELVVLPVGRPAVAVALLLFAPGTAVAPPRLQSLLPALPLVAPLLQLGRPARPRRGPWRPLLAAAALLLVAALFIPFPHRLSAPLTLVPESRRVVTAPFDGILAESKVERGERVTAGQLLVRLEDRELRLEHERLLAEAERVGRERDVALAAGKAAEAELKRLEAERARLTAEVIAERLRRVEVTSPIDGVVTTDELDRAVGAPVQAGDPLFEVAPLDAMTVEIALPAREIGYLGEAPLAELHLEAFPDWSLSLPVERVSPKATLREGENVFLLEVTLDNADGRLLPGLRGEAVMEVGEEPLWWLLFHAPWERVERWLR